MVVNGSNTYTGGTYINAGRIQFTNGAALGTGNVTVLPGGEAYFSNGGTVANNFFIAGYGATEGYGPIRIGGTLTGTITLIGNSRLGVGSTTTYMGQITGNYDVRLSI